MANEIQRARSDGKNSLRQAMRRLNRFQAVGLIQTSAEVVKGFLPSTVRLVTNRLRHLPTAVIVGAKRAGTRKLYGYLLKHPRCFGAVEKEIDYFSKHSRRSVAWYRSRFPLRRSVARRRGHVLEVSPSYLATPSALPQMKSVLPDAQLIVLLRDPVSRAFAHYQHAKIRYEEPRSFEEAVADELRSNEFPAKRGVALAPGARPMLGYVSRGYYALQLEQLLNVYPRNRVHVIENAPLYEDPNALCNGLFSFLGLENFDVEPGKAHRRGEDEEAMDPRVAGQLREHYRPYDELLKEIIGPFRWMTSQAHAA